MSRVEDRVAGHPQESDEAYRLFFDRNPQPMWVWDVETLHFLAANVAAIHHYGYSRDEFLAMKFADIQAPKDSSRFSKDLLNCPTFFDHPEICTCRRKDGTLIEVEIRGQRIDWAGSPAHLVAAHDVTDHKSAELALRESEERVGLILASAAEAIFGCDRVGTCMFCNHAAAHMLGFDDPAELLGKNMHTTEHHTRVDGTPYPLEECPIYVGLQKGQGTHRDDEIFWRKDGTSFPVEYWSHLMVQDDRVLCVVAFMDISARKQAEEALRKSEELKTRLIASSHDCIKVLDIGGRLLSMNEGGMEALEICDLSPFVNSSWIDFWDGDDQEAARAAVEVASRGGTGRFVGYFATRITKQPKWWDVVVSPIRGPKGEPEQLVAVSRDITEHRQNEEALREANVQVTRSEERWRAVFDNSAIGVALTDLGGHFIAVNRVYEKMVGYTDEELRKLAFLDITHEDDASLNRDLITDLLGGKQKQFQIEKQYRRKDGSLMWVSNNVSLVPGTESMPQFIMALSEDITERKRAEEALRRSEERARTLLEINNAVIANLVQETLLHSISKAVHRAVPYDAMRLTLREPETGTFRILAAEGIPQYFHEGQQIEPHGSCVGWVFDHQRPLLRSNLEEEQRFSNDAQLVAEGMLSHCVVPLVIHGGKSTGTLSVTSKRRAQYSEKDAEFLQEVANQVSLALENMRAYEEVAALKTQLEKENIYLQEEIRSEHNFEEIVGNSSALISVLRSVDQVAATDSTVLILGETGTGKELIARAIHDRGTRKERTLVKVNCSAISAGLVESELFGHVKGAFTGALERRTGRFELANGGTIFLDEVGELPLETQVKLLRILQEREFEPVGSSCSIKVDVRVIAATNRDLKEAMQEGRFRSDLFYRLNVFPVQVPPLRDRRSDIPLLVKFFMGRFSMKFGKKVDVVSQPTMDRLVSYAWPGNIRELENVIERAFVLSQSPVLELDYELESVPASRVSQGTNEKLAPEVQPVEGALSRLPTLEEVERNHILAALKLTLGVIEGPKGAAKILKLHPNTLRNRLEKFGIKRSDHRPT
jgi:formate hydrogenlyase transcriptional activator